MQYEECVEIQNKETQTIKELRLYPEDVVITTEDVAGDTGNNTCVYWQQCGGLAGTGYNLKDLVSAANSRGSDRWSKFKSVQQYMRKKCQSSIFTSGDQVHAPKVVLLWEKIREDPHKIDVFLQ